MRSVLLGLFYAVLWWMLTEGAQAWLVGIPMLIVCTWLTQRLLPAARYTIRWQYAPAFAWFFISNSILAGVDVARRTLHPRLQLNPGFCHFPTGLPDGPPRYFFGAVISLLPGTLCSGFDESGIVLHALDIDDDVEQSNRALERQVARLYGIKLDD
ncbi:Na+/H+ antiporter subunit E [Aliidiomarina sp. Khilg15.8]